ncbi:unnamed protein product [Bursaphelenchus xylophilus]|uniref:(pine wood nematode) hypothetical protein n=1 Tax=Bursaphelenchus xylophilus TaxID=6326 RepID=A0A1I7RW15_BURXY|nr:unnamed protein product [Bursaphelenchus xylophilus]CAG9095006.1 unnamed protein product [Bursaphelenchus xylophilus]
MNIIDGNHRYEDKAKAYYMFSPQPEVEMYPNTVETEIYVFTESLKFVNAATMKRSLSITVHNAIEDVLTTLGFKQNKILLRTAWKEGELSEFFAGEDIETRTVVLIIDTRMDHLETTTSSYRTLSPSLASVTLSGLLSPNGVPGETIQHLQNGDFNAIGQDEWNQCKKIIASVLQNEFIGRPVFAEDVSLFLSHLFNSCTKLEDGVISEIVQAAECAHEEQKKQRFAVLDEFIQQNRREQQMRRDQMKQQQQQQNYNIPVPIPALNVPSTSAPPPPIVVPHQEPVNSRKRSHWDAEYPNFPKSETPVSSTKGERKKKQSFINLSDAEKERLKYVNQLTLFVMNEKTETICGGTTFDGPINAMQDVIFRTVPTLDRVIFIEYITQDGRIATAKLEDPPPSSRVFVTVDTSSQNIAPEGEFNEIPPELANYQLTQLIGSVPEAPQIFEKFRLGQQLEKEEMKKIKPLIAQPLQRYVSRRAATQKERQLWLKHLFTYFPLWDQLISRSSPHRSEFDAAIFNNFYNFQAKRHRVIRKVLNVRTSFE